MHQEGSPGIELVETLGDIGDDDDGELESLALVDAHDAHDVLARAERARDGEVGVALAQVLEEAQEAEEAAVIRLLILCRAVGEHTQIGLAQQAALEAAHVVVVARLTVERPDELRHAVAHGIAAPAVERGTEVGRAVG